VTDSANGMPLESVMVIARSRRFVRRAITNADGSYTISNLRPGIYRLMAHKRGYVPKHYPEPVILEAGQAVTGINFALVQGSVPPPPPPQGFGSISGTVINAVTQLPIANATVHAMCADSTQHHCGGMARTNSDGTYTIPNLRPGTYIVKACAMGFNMAIYPNPVIVVENQNTPNIDFALTPRQP
ncbi:MAG: carboxypeptidase-like regulatory domain-containing protein, partial [candidate division WOR-3 bacterium]|nr:carboxypeptidase-like regulatory domain-containing protein [candidate division WOR-3 bacterium]